MALLKKDQFILGRGCGAVGRLDASDARDPQVESRHQQDFFDFKIWLSTVNSLEKMKINGEEAGKGPL